MCIIHYFFYVNYFKEIISYISLTNDSLVIYNQEKILRFDMNIYDFVVKRIYELCEERNITPNALSYLAGISQSTVKSILYLTEKAKIRE